MKMKAELHLAVKTSNVAKNKLKLARKVTEARLKECLPIASFENEHSQVLITLMSALIDEDSFDIDPDTDSLTPKVNFLKDVEDSIKKNDDEDMVKERLEVVRNKLVERVKETSVGNKGRRMSISSVGSSSSIDRKRKSSTEAQNVKDSSRSKSSSVPIIS